MGNKSTPATHEVYAAWDNLTQSGGCVDFRGTKAECAAYITDACCPQGLTVRAVRYTAKERAALDQSAARAAMLASFGVSKK